MRLVRGLERELGRHRITADALGPTDHQRRRLASLLEDHLLDQARGVRDLVPRLAGAALDEDEAPVPGGRVDLALGAGVWSFFF